MKIHLSILPVLLLVLAGCNRSGESQDQSYVPSVGAARDVGRLQSEPSTKPCKVTTKRGPSWHAAPA